MTGPSDRAFALVLAALLALAAWKTRLHGWALAACAAVLLAAAVKPALLHPLNVLWMRLGRLLAKITNPILTGVVFFAVFTPAAIVLRALGRNPLRLGFDAAAPTYWLARRARPESMREQF